jgi:tetratricopeptide (TPR) repeat protein
VISLARRLRRIGCRSLLCFVAAASLHAAQSSTGVVNSITAALRARDFDRALELARAAKAQSPHDAQILTLEGMAFSGLGKNQEALSAYDAALTVSPDYLAALEGAAQIEYQAGNDHAVALLERIVRIRPGDSTSHAMLAVLAYRHGDCRTAVEHFRASEGLLFSRKVALEQYGFCLIRLNRAKQAVPLYQRLQEADPKNPRARLRLGTALYLAGQSQAALAALQPVLDDGQVDPDVLDVASSAYEASGNTPRAADLLRRAIVRRPDNPKYYLDFATLCFDHASFRVGIDMLNAGLQKLPNSAPLYLARGILYIQLGDVDQGQADFQHADRLDPQQAFASESKSLAELQTGDSEEALANVRAELKERHDDAFLYYLLAEILDRQGATPGSPQFQQAVRAANRALELQPDLTEARDLLGGLYLKSGELTKAADECRLALRYDASDQVALYHLTQALRKSGNRGEISELLKRLATLREDSRKREALRNRYKLVEIPDSQDTKP